MSRMLYETSSYNRNHVRPDSQGTRHDDRIVHDVHDEYNLFQNKQKQKLTIP